MGTGAETTGERVTEGNSGMALQPGKYDRSMEMQCPTCGGTRFEHDDSPLVRCVKCDRTMTKDDLRDANGDRIEAEFDDMKAEVFKDAITDMKKALKKWK